MVSGGVMRKYSWMQAQHTGYGVPCLSPSQFELLLKLR
jgi:hypothetical protein